MTPEKTQPASPPYNSLAGYVPLLLIIAALALRLWGITWALPDGNRYFSYHVDESMVVGHALDLNPLAGKLDPNFYNYGSLTLLVDGLVIHAGRAAGLMSAAPADFRPGGLAVPTAPELLTARLITAFLGAGTVGFLYSTGRILYGQAAGIVAGTAYAVAPLAVQHAHFATVDIGAVFWIAGSLYFAAKHIGESPPAPNSGGAGVCTRETRSPVGRDASAPSPAPPELRAGGLRNLLLAGIFAGLAAAAKYNCGLVLLAGIAAWWLTAPRKPLPFILLFVATAAGFLIGCPGIILNLPAVMRDVLFEAQHVSEGHGAVFTDTPPGLIYHIAYNLRWGLTLPLLLVCLFGIGVAAVRRRPGDALLVAFALPYYLLIGIAAVKFSRYTLPLFPPLFLLIGAAWDGWQNARARTSFRAFVVCGIVSALGFSVALDQTMTRPDPRDQAAAFIRATPSLQTIAFAAGPWNFSPSLNPFLAHPIPFVVQEATLLNEPLRLIPSVKYYADGTLERNERGVLQAIEWTQSLLTVPATVDAVAFGELHYNDWLRTRYPQAQSFLKDANALYPVHKNFTNPVTLFGIPVVPIYALPGAPWYDLPRQTLPHDMLYTNSSVSIWTR